MPANFKWAVLCHKIKDSCLFLQEIKQGTAKVYSHGERAAQHSRNAQAVQNDVVRPKGDSIHRPPKFNVR